MTEALQKLASSTREHLRARAEPVVQAWIDWVRSRIRSKTIRALPEHAIRNHVPPVVGSLADYIADPIQAMRQTMLGHLRIHGQIRRDQGYSVGEVLSEFDGLAQLITLEVHEHLEEYGDGYEASDVLEISSRLATGLRAVSFACVSAYQESDDRLRQSLSSHLEQFSRAIAHELRNPLNTVHLIASILRDAPAVSGDHVRLNEQLDAIETAVGRAVHFLDNIGILAVASAAQAGANLVDLVTAVDTARSELSALAMANSVEIRVADDLPAVQAESIVLHLVLVNLIGNSIKYRDPEKDEGWVEISARLIREEFDSGFCELTVEDNGVGIAAELLPRVMQHGFRANPEIAQGTGLGLHLVQRLLHDRGGHIEIESVEGKGTSILCRFRCLEAGHTARSSDTLDMMELVRMGVAGRVDQQNEDAAAEA